MKALNTILLTFYLFPSIALQGIMIPSKGFLFFIECLCEERLAEGAIS